MRQCKSLELSFHAPNTKELLVFMVLVCVLEAELPPKTNFALSIQQANVFL